MFGYDVEDVGACTIEHASGTVGTLLSIFNGVRGREERRLEVFFEHGAVEVTTNFLVGAGEDSMLVQRPDAPAERLAMQEMRERHFQTRGYRPSGLLRVHVPRDSRVHRSGTRRPARVARLSRCARRAHARRGGVPLCGARSAGRDDRRPRDLNLAGGRLVAVEDTAEHRRDGRIEGRGLPEVRTQREVVKSRLLPHPYERAHPGRVDELDTGQLEDQRLHLRRESGEDPGAHHPGGEHIEDTR